MRISVYHLLALYGAALSPVLMVALIVWSSKYFSISRLRSSSTSTISWLALLFQITILIVFVTSVACFSGSGDFQLLVLSIAIGAFVYAIPYRILRYRKVIVIPEKYLSIYRTWFLSLWFMTVLFIFFILRTTLPSFTLKLSFAQMAILGSLTLALWAISHLINYKIRREERNEYWGIVDQQLRYAEQKANLLGQISTHGTQEDLDKKTLEFQSILVRIKEKLGFSLSDDPNDKKQKRKYPVWLAVLGSYLTITLLAYGMFFPYGEHIYNELDFWRRVSFGIIIWLGLALIITKYWWKNQ